MNVWCLFKHAWRNVGEPVWVSVWDAVHDRACIRCGKVQLLAQEWRAAQREADDRLQREIREAEIMVKAAQEAT